MKTERDKDLANVQWENQREINLAFDRLLGFVRGDFNLTSAGYKSLEEATTLIITKAKEENERRLVSFEKRWKE